MKEFIVDNLFKLFDVRNFDSIKKKGKYKFENQKH